MVIEEVLKKYDSALLDLLHLWARLLRDWPEGTFRLVWVPSHTDTLQEPLCTDRIVKASSRAVGSCGALPSGWIAGNKRADMLARASGPGRGRGGSGKGS